MSSTQQELEENHLRQTNVHKRHKMLQLVLKGAGMHALLIVPRNDCDCASLSRHMCTGTT